MIIFSGKCPYSTPCSVPKFFNPLGIKIGGCVQVITPPYNCNLNLIYSLEWLTIFTIITYLIYLLKQKNN